ncbi:tRNA pseudouridine(65) synthase TruC [Saccharobesus litoralis]|uniref:tRNA pseudouridine synthase C n=1 Tax=Saccharobesus litoralis TaxID=2172099 RepID=A0A2S0VTY3_9ALTE|nr:tRNA pseudouridine(65) synthase TruC [Saccharobesus litoralis]AWB67643.1 tRNA pseudouridine(65) synthase TruC [Saccharobesus litoralis]
MRELDVLYQDDYLIAVNKPSGLLVHRSLIDKHETEFALQTVRDQIGQYVYPVHRLDRPTSGVLIMALSSDIARKICLSIEQRLVKKQYLALCRGYIPEKGEIDYPLVEQLDKLADKDASKTPEAKSAFTAYERVASSEIPVEINRYPSSRFSLVRLYPREGRKHQIRRHLAHLRHPIIYDVNYGDNKYNRYFKNQNSEARLALHAERMIIPHPVTNANLDIRCKLDISYQQMLKTAHINFSEEVTL